jgi:malonyl CoA-acyl carrier protein transacylase
MLDEEVLAKASQGFLHALMAHRVRQLEDHLEAVDAAGTNTQELRRMSPPMMRHGSPRSATTKSRRV